ncbi:MAG: hypothetical protein GMKNLPBB_03394 [Myxococcota bacterium]|nr:hypothetical protein [Myxococcota bacterium]
MHRFRRNLAAAAALFILLAPGRAPLARGYDDRDWSLRAQAGYATLKRGVDLSGWTLAAGLERRLPWNLHLGLQLEGADLRGDTGGQEPLAIAYHMSTLTGLLRYVIDIGPVQPFITGQAGAMLVTRTSVPGDQFAQPLAAAGLGLDVFVSDHFSLGAQASYLWIRGVEPSFPGAMRIHAIARWML